MRGWLRSGLIFQRCKEKNLSLFLPKGAFPRLNRQDVEEIAQDTVVHALRGFREEVLIPGEWNPGKRASLTTFFIGQCLIRFTGVFRTAVSELRRRQHNEMLRADMTEHLTMASDFLGPEERALIAHGIQQHRQRLPKTTFEILTLQAHGYTEAEIAEMLGISVGAVESRLYRHRSANRRSQAAG